MTKKNQNFRTVTRDMTKKKAAQLAVNVVEFQKATLGNSIKLLGKAQEQTGRILHDMLKNAAWVPSEGREVVDEWNHTMKRAREEFHKTSDKSFDLILHYLERAQKEEGGRTAGVKPSAKPAAKKPAAKKPAAKKSAPSKKPTVKKVAAQQAAAKKPAARKKTPVKPPAAREE